jgi:hypothetical protein
MGGGPTAGLEVALRVFQGNSEVESQSATTDAEGRFQFVDLQTGAEWAYLIQVRYEDVTYSKGMLSFQNGQDEIDAQIVVFEKTGDDEGIDVTRAHILITPSDGGLSVTEVYVFQNPTDRTYIGTSEIEGRRWTSRFTLPKESQELGFDDGSLGGRFLPIEGGFVDTEPHWPGTTSVVYSYRVGCPGGICDLTRPASYPIVELNALIPDTGAQIESEQLVFQGQQEAQGGSFLNYVGRDLGPGKDLDLRVRLPGAAPSPAATTTTAPQMLPWIILGGVIVALFLIYPFWKRRVQAQAREDK